MEGGEQASEGNNKAVECVEATGGRSRAVEPLTIQSARLAKRLPGTLHAQVSRPFQRSLLCHISLAQHAIRRFRVCQLWLRRPWCEKNFGPSGSLPETARITASRSVGGGGRRQTALAGRSCTRPGWWMLPVRGEKGARLELPRFDDAAIAAAGERRRKGLLPNFGGNMLWRCGQVSIPASHARSPRQKLTPR